MALTIKPHSRTLANGDLEASSTAQQTIRWALLILLLVVFVRFASLGAYPLTDTTEARYAEIGRVMAANGDYITPQLEPGVPFWAKPPLSIWETALSLKLMGSNEFAARLPSFINFALTAVLVSWFGHRHLGSRVGTLASLIMWTSLLGFISAGAVMTDLALMLATTVSMIAFLEYRRSEQRAWAYLWFAALGTGLLAKGPIATVLVLLPTFIWVVAERQWALVARMPWKAGLCITALVSVPWYVMAEAKTPGFLSYFMLGEHLMRFIDSGWQGDMYGNAHSETRGTIWIFALAAFFPWWIPAGSAVACRVRQGWKKPQTTQALETDTLLSGDRQSKFYLLLFAISPMVFFSFSGNIIPTYVLPALPAFALLSADVLKSIRHATITTITFSLPVPLVLLGILMTDEAQRLDARSEKNPIATTQTISPDSRLVYYPTLPHSARFYSRGTAESVENATALQNLVNTEKDVVIRIRHGATDIEEMLSRGGFTKTREEARHSVWRPIVDAD